MARNVSPDFESVYFALVDDVVGAYNHYSVYLHLRRAAEAAEPAIVEAAFFWRLVITAQRDSAVFHLCRAYDSDPKAIGLRSLITRCPRSIPLHLSPDHVLPLSEAGPGRSREFRIEALRKGWAWAPRRWVEVTEDTGVGNPACATAQRGSRYFEAVSRAIATFLRDLAAADPASMYS